MKVWPFLFYIFLECHKVYDDVFLSSSASSSETDPWFCEPCLAGVENPVRFHNGYFDFPSLALRALSESRRNFQENG